MTNFIDSYQNNLIDLIKSINKQTLSEIINAIDNTNGKIYIIGNGGSAATSSHMVNDLGVGLSRRNIRNFDIESLSDNTAVCTALANDVGYENIFYHQLLNKLTSDDILLAISCSGNSGNIIKAVKYANEKNATVIGFTGFDGGELKDLSNIALHVQTDKNQYGVVEDLHMIFNHMIYSYFISTQKAV